jgi:hypothetical protein
MLHPIRVLSFIILCTIFILFGHNSILAQGTGTLRGNVIDSLSGEALPFANILLDGTFLGASADLNGNFIITGIPAQKNYLVKISYLGYNSQIIPVFIEANQITKLRVILSPITIRLDAVEKIGDKYDKPNETDLSLQRISIREIEYLPQGVETDIFR